MGRGQAPSADKAPAHGNRSSTQEEGASSKAARHRWLQCSRAARLPASTGPGRGGAGRGGAGGRAGGSGRAGWGRAGWGRAGWGRGGVGVVGTFITPKECGVTE